MKWIIIIYDILFTLSFFLHSLKWKQTSGMYHVCGFDYFFSKKKTIASSVLQYMFQWLTSKKKNSISIDSIWQLTMKWILYKCMVCVCVLMEFLFFILAVFSVCVCKTLCGALNETKQKKIFTKFFFHWLSYYMND